MILICKNFFGYRIEVSHLLIMTIAMIFSISVVLYSNITTSNKINNLERKLVSSNKIVNELKSKKTKEMEQYYRDVGKIMMHVRFLSDVEFDRSYLNMISTAFYDASKKYNIDPRELVAMAWTESRFISVRTSVKGAKGIMQVMPLWLEDEEISSEVGLKSASDLYDPILNIYAGAYIYNHYRDYWKKRGISEGKIRKLVLLSYNRGYLTVKISLQNGEDPENGYHKIVSKKYNKLAELDTKIS